VLAVGIVDRFARARVDLARHLQHLDAVRQQLEQLVEPRLEIEGLQQRLLLLGADVHQAGDEIGEPDGSLDALQGGDHFLGHLRQELQDLDRALLEAAGAALDVHVDMVGVLDELHARGRERVAFQELEHAEALHALADGVMRTVGCGDVAQHVGVVPSSTIVGSGLFGFGLALRRDAERTLQARGAKRSRPTVSETPCPGTAQRCTDTMISASSGNARGVLAAAVVPRLRSPRRARRRRR
jgi:hypothetical protein